jgi:hypothetical protein
MEPRKRLRLGMDCCLQLFAQSVLRWLSALAARVLETLATYL